MSDGPSAAGSANDDGIDGFVAAAPTIPVHAGLADADQSLGAEAQRLELMAGALQVLPDPVVLLDGQRRVLTRNARADALLAAPPDAAPGRRRLADRNAELLELFLAREERDATGAYARELTLQRPDDGEEQRFEVVSQPLGARGAQVGVRLVVLRDVTDLRRAALELERQVELVRRAEVRAASERDRLDLILEHVADPIVVTSAGGAVTLRNRQAERLFGDEHRAAASPGQLENDARLTTFLEGFAAGHEITRRGELTLRANGGGTLPAEVVSGKIVDERGRTAAIVSVLHDLTEQADNARLYEELKRFSAELEERVRLATADLERQNARLHWQSRELEKASRLKSEFLASMSHELRTPINALLGYAALVLDRVYGGLTDGQEEALRRIRGSARHLLELINDILDLAKIEAGKMPVHLELVPLGELLGEVGEQMESLLADRAVQFRCTAPADAPALYSDRTKLRQILLNLLSNAAKFTHEGEVVLDATLVDGGERIRFTVRDTGIGIREGDLAAIWEDFRQVDQSRTREYGGTGLGLSITRKLVQRLEGEIAVESAFGEGSTFTVTLPVREPARVVDAFRRDALSDALGDGAGAEGGPTERG